MKENVGNCCAAIDDVRMVIFYIIKHTYWNERDIN
jgi:hypothetical protein